MSSKWQSRIKNHITIRHQVNLAKWNNAQKATFVIRSQTERSTENAKSDRSKPTEETRTSTSIKPNVRSSERVHYYLSGLWDEV